MDSQPFITVYPSESHATPGGRVRFHFRGVRAQTAAYSVRSADPDMVSWCRVLLPAADGRPGEVIVDVPDDARPGRYPLRLVATVMGREIATGDLAVRVQGERCLRVVAAPTFSLEADGTVEVTLRVVNCGIVDANLVLRAHHRDGWSFTMDAPELVIGVGDDPVTVKVVLRARPGHSVDRGDRITVEVETGTRWQSLTGRVPRPRPVWPWVAAAAVAVVVVALAAGVVSGLGSGSGDGGEPPAIPGGNGSDEGGDGEDTDGEPVDPVVIQSLSVDASGCDIAVEWEADGNPDGRLELYRDDELLEESPVGSGSVDESVLDILGDGPYDVTYELVAYDSDGGETDRRSDSDGDQCNVVD